MVIVCGQVFTSDRDYQWVCVDKIITTTQIYSVSQSILCEIYSRHQSDVDYRVCVFCVDCVVSVPPMIFIV